MTNHVARAKLWIAKAAIAAGLAIVPMAAAQADVIFPATGSCNSSGMGWGGPSFTQPTCTASQLAPNGGITGTRISLDAPFDRNGTSVDFNTFGGGVVIGTLAAGSTLTLGWAVNLVNAGQYANMYMYLGSNSGTLAATWENGGISLVNGMNVGTMTFTTLFDINDGDYLNFGTGLYLNNQGPGSVLSAVFDFNPGPVVTESSVPEPASALILAVGVFGAMRLRSRRKA